MSDTKPDIDTADEHFAPEEPERQPEAEPEAQVVYAKAPEKSTNLRVVLAGLITFAIALSLSAASAVEPPGFVVLLLLLGLLVWLAGLIGKSRAVSCIALAVLALALIIELFSFSTTNPNAKPPAKKRGDYGSSAPASTATYATQAPLTAASQPTYATQEPVATTEPQQPVEPTTTVRTTSAKPKPTAAIQAPPPPTSRKAQPPADPLPAEQPPAPSAAPPTHTGNGGRITGTVPQPPG